MNIHSKNEGFIIPLTLILIGALVAIVMGIYNQGSVFGPFIITMTEKEQAKMLALGGVNIGMSQLAFQEEKKEKTPQQNPEKEFLEHMLPVLGNWQNFTLKKDTDGIDGTVSIAITSEEGKININKIYDFERKKFKGEGLPRGDWKMLLKDIFKKIQERIGAKDLFTSFEQFLKKQTDPLQEVTQLLTIKEFKPFEQFTFFHPSNALESAKDKPPVYLTDIFTVFSTKDLIQPWFISPSLISLFNLQLNKEVRNKKTVEKLLKNFKSTITIQRDWNTLFKPVYQRELQNLPKGVASIFNTKFEAETFSILSRATFGQARYEIVAIVTRVKTRVKDKTKLDVKIKRLYVL